MMLLLDLVLGSLLCLRTELQSLVVELDLKVYWVSKVALPEIFADLSKTAWNLM